MIETFESRIEEHQPLLLSIVKRIYKRLPRFIPYEDVLSCGQLGLAQAARTYQPQPGAKFSTYAYYRISGAIYDGLSRMNWSSRTEYRKYKAMQNASDALASRDGKKPGSDPEDYARWFAESVENLSMVYLFSSADTENPIENQIPSEDDDPRQAIERKELVEKLNRIIATLPADEEKFIRLVYFEGLSLAETAKKNGQESVLGKSHAYQNSENAGR